MTLKAIKKTMKLLLLNISYSTKGSSESLQCYVLLMGDSFWDICKVLARLNVGIEWQW